MVEKVKDATTNEVDQNNQKDLRYMIHRHA